MNEKLKDFTMSELFQELLARCGKEMSGYGCLANVVRENFCKYTADSSDKEAGSLKRTFIFLDNSRMSAEHPASHYEKWVANPHNLTCQQMRENQAMSVFTGRKYI